ncbi:MAG: hypothetical protein ACC656_02815, partial [Candidatus Heimdallarchaeota archaeon]
MNLEFLRNVKGRSGSKYAKESYLKKTMPEEYVYIFNFVKQHNLEHFSFQQQVYHAIYNITKSVICAKHDCNNLVKFVSKSKGYSTYCSKKCAGNSVEVLNTRKQNNFKKHGVEYTFQSVETKQKRVDTLKSRYGKTTPMAVEEFIEKRSKTNLERYGVEYVTQNLEIKKKISESVKKIMSSNIKKRHKTNLDKYGVEEVLAVKEIRDKRKSTNLKRFGVEESLAAEKVQSKKRATNLERYGVEEITSLDEFHKTNSLVKLQKLIQKIKINDLNILDYYLHDNTIDYKCVTCKNISNLLYRLYYQRQVSKTNPCLICNPIGSKRGYELKVQAFLDEYDIEYVANTKSIITPLELDFYIPKLNIAIECNGTYYHNELFRDEKYHRKKYDRCKQLGIKLIQIWQDDWDLYYEIIKSRLLNVL